MAGYRANYAPRSVAPTTWAHASGCVWVSAATINRFAWHVGLARRAISFRTLDLMVEQTRAAAVERAAARRAHTSA